jgi:hypothetical protein
MKYTFNCTIDNAVLTVEAKNDAEAMKKMMVAGKKHIKEAHPTAAPMTEAEMEKMFRSGWKKG